jgi:hypoxanthine-guanine phosphoribosyltransferase
MRAVIEYLTVKHPASISTVTLLTRDDSPFVTEKSYEGFTIDNEWVVGYGMDNEKGYARNYDGVFAL